LQQFMICCNPCCLIYNGGRGDLETTMNKNEKPQDIRFGYWYSYPSEHAPGASRLEVNITDIPTEEHFDPQRLHFSVVAGDRFIEDLKVTHPWLYKDDYQICAGLVQIIDRKDKTEEAFSFGGRLKIESHESFTTCILESSAPILEISGANTIICKFIEEIEIILAERRAEWASKEEIFEQRLIQVDAYELYIAILNSLIKKYENLSYRNHFHIQEFLNFLHKEVERLKTENKTKLLLHSLEEIL
jgi:hypothetical protein